MRKALEWIEKHTFFLCSVIVKRKTYAEFVGHIYKLKRIEKPDVWYVIKCLEQPR